MKFLTKTGFTLIELLVVITIIGILATGATTVYTSQIQKARDTVRITDVKALQSGIEQYYQDDTQYPQGGIAWIGAGLSVTDYLPTLAEDPKHGQTCNASRCGYIYNVGIDSVWIERWSFEISTAFENEGNRTKKAVDSSDNGNDPARLEFGAGAPIAPLNTNQDQGTAFTGTDIVPTDTTATVLVVTKSAVSVK